MTLSPVLYAPFVMSQQTAVFYTIHVKGLVNPSWSPDLYSLTIADGNDGTTRLTGSLADQAALLGCLVRLVNMGTKLLSVESETVQINIPLTAKGQETMTLPTMTMEAEEAKIFAQIEVMREGWNTGDGARFADPFAEDADYTVWNGLYSSGKQTIAAQHQHIFDTFYANTTLHYGKKHLRFLTEDVALVRLEHGNVTRENGEAVQDKGVRPLFVFVKKGEQWQIAAFQNTPIIEMTAD